MCVVEEDSDSLVDEEVDQNAARCDEAIGEVYVREDSEHS